MALPRLRIGILGRFVVEAVVVEAVVVEAGDLLSVAAGADLVVDSPTHSIRHLHPR